eukprot:753888-Hanusia_phi.AAC.3
MPPPLPGSSPPHLCTCLHIDNVLEELDVSSEPSQLRAGAKLLSSAGDFVCTHVFRNRKPLDGILVSSLVSWLNTCLPAKSDLTASPAAPAPPPAPLFSPAAYRIEDLNESPPSLGSQTSEPFSNFTVLQAPSYEICPRHHRIHAMWRGKRRGEEGGEERGTIKEGTSCSPSPSGIAASPRLIPR